MRGGTAVKDERRGKERGGQSAGWEGGGIRSL